METFGIDWPRELDFEIYGEYNGAYAFYDSSATIAAMCCEVVDDLVFIYGGGKPIYVYNESEIMRLTEAYDGGVITKDDLIDINEKRNGVLHWYTDEDDISGYHRI